MALSCTSTADMGSNMFGTANRNKITVSNRNTYTIVTIAIHMVSLPNYRVNIVS